jgi:hypothetical protein
MNPSNLFVLCTFEGDTATPPKMWVAEITMREPVRQSFACRLMETEQILFVDYSSGVSTPWPASDESGVQYMLNMHDIYEAIPASPGQNDLALLTFPDGSKFLCFVESIGETTSVQLYHDPYPRLIVDDRAIIETDWTVHTSGEAFSSLQRCSINLNVLSGMYWPLRQLADGRDPKITSGHALRNPDRPKHWGVDLFYRWTASDGDVTIGDGGATKDRDGKPKWFIPDGTMAVAVAHGTVARAGNSSTGFFCWIEISPDLFAGYFHLSRLDVSVGAQLQAGDAIGIVGDNPSDNDARHLHFELHRGDTKNHPRGSIDPEGDLRTAQILPAI